jgi:hypothetical protein
VPAAVLMEDVAVATIDEKAWPKAAGEKVPLPDPA